MRWDGVKKQKNVTNEQINYMGDERIWEGRWLVLARETEIDYMGKRGTNNAIYGANESYVVTG
jgi:hypothetical protein